MKRPRFSIVTLLLATVLVAGALALVVSHEQLIRLEGRHAQVLRETGYLEVSDPAKVYVRELSCPAPLTWQFQIYLPPEHELSSGLGVDLNEQGVPTRLLDSPRSGRTGQFTLTVSLHHREGRWRLSRYVAASGSDFRLAGNDFDWLQEQQHESGYARLRHGPAREYAPDESIVLLTLQNKDDPAPGDGSLMLWLEPDLRANYRKPTGSDTETPRDAQRRVERQSYLIRE